MTELLGRGQLKMALRVSDKYLLTDILPRHWEQAAQKAGYSPETTLALLRHQIAVLPDLAVQTAARCRNEGIDHPVIDHLVDLISARIASLRTSYGAEILPETERAGFNE